MRLIITFIAILTFRSILFSQDDQNLPAKITNFVSLYSTFDWEEPHYLELAITLGEETASQIMRRSHESFWPVGISTIDKRLQNALLMKDYQVFYVCTIADNIAIMKVPARINLSMNDEMRPETDIYFLLQTSSVEITNEQITPEPNQAIDNDLSVVLKSIMIDYKNDFIQYIGDEIGAGEEEKIASFDSKTEIKGTQQSFFIKDLLSSSISYYTAFQGYTDPAIAMLDYNNIVKQIENISFDFGMLKKLDEVITGTTRSQAFYVYLPDGVEESPYKKMMIEVYIEQWETFDLEGNLIDDWTPTISIY